MSTNANSVQLFNCIYLIWWAKDRLVRRYLFVITAVVGILLFTQQNIYSRGSVAKAEKQLHNF